MKRMRGPCARTEDSGPSRGGDVAASCACTEKLNKKNTTVAEKNTDNEASEDKVLGSLPRPPRARRRVWVFAPHMDPRCCVKGAQTPAAILIVMVARAMPAWHRRQRGARAVAGDA